MDERPHAADCIAANASSWSALGAGRAIQRSSLREFYFLVVSFSNGAAAPLEGFEMTARIIVPVTRDLMEEVFDRAPALRRSRGDVLARDPRFAIGIYRAAVATGAMDFVRLKR